MNAKETARCSAFECLGREINLDSRRAVQEALFDQLELPATAPTSRGPSVSTPALQSLLSMTGSPFVDHLLRYRLAA